MQSDNSYKTGLLLIGGIHHILHLVPVAAELEKQSGHSVTVYVTSFQEAAMCEQLLTRLGARRTHVHILQSARMLRALSPKLSYLLSGLSIWKQLDALIVAERTSTILRYITKELPVFIHIPHGAGDRGKSYDKRIRHFDRVLTAGPKDKSRMVELGLTDEMSCHVTGYIKPYVVERLGETPPQLFNNDKPIILYNPHFSPALSSWPNYGEDLLEAFAKHKQYNFIFAPHMRLFANAKKQTLHMFERFKDYENIHIDLGSERSTDMSYTRAADIYLGDVSSQVYEFLTRPKPCIFIGKAETNWAGNPDYAHWSYGKVCQSSADVLTAIEQAQRDHPLYIQAQEKGRRAAMGEPEWNPLMRAAGFIKSALDAAKK